VVSSGTGLAVTSKSAKVLGSGKLKLTQGETGLFSPCAKDYSALIKVVFKGNLSTKL
jgi:hypothetical protein